MKTQIPISLFAFLILLCSCNEQDVKTNIQQKEAEAELAQGQLQVSLENAQQMISAWRSVQTANLIPDIFAFKLNRGSLDAVLTNENAATIRIYLCMHSGQPDALLVGVDNQGNDLVSDGIYDISSPCPPTCCPSCQLYQAGDSSPSSELVDHQGQSLALADAEQLIENWKVMLNNATVPDIHAFKLHRPSVDAILNNTDAATIRMYLGADNGQVTSMLVGVDKYGNDLLEAGIQNLTAPCPRTCDEPSPLYNLP